MPVTYALEGAGWHRPLGWEPTLERALLRALAHVAGGRAEVEILLDGELVGLARRDRHGQPVALRVHHVEAAPRAVVA